MVFNRHLKALNLCNHSDTIACVLYELLVKFGIDYRGFPNPRSRFHKFRFCSIFKVLLRCRVSVTACILYIRNAWLSRGFLKVFWRISSSKNIYRLLWSAFRGVSAARQLDYYSKEYDSCQQFFGFFDKFWERFLGKVYIGVVRGDRYKGLWWEGVAGGMYAAPTRATWRE